MAPGSLVAVCITKPGEERMCAVQGSPGSLQLEFGASGQLNAVIWEDPPGEPLTLSVTVDGAEIASQTFPYSIQPASGTCGPCYVNPEFVVDN